MREPCFEQLIWLLEFVARQLRRAYITSLRAHEPIRSELQCLLYSHGNSLWFLGQEKNAPPNTGLNSVSPSLLRIASWEMNPPLDQRAMLKCLPCRQCLGGKCSSDTKPGVALLGTSLLRISHCLATFSFDILEELHAAAAKACALGLYEKVLKRKLRAELKCVWMCHRKDGRSQNSSRKFS